MTSAELEAAANKTAFPWQCIVCSITYHYKTKKLTWGYVCVDCWQRVKQRVFDESERVFNQ